MEVHCPLIQILKRWKNFRSFLDGGFLAKLMEEISMKTLKWVEEPVRGRRFSSFGYIFMLDAPTRKSSLLLNKRNEREEGGMGTRTQREDKRRKSLKRYVIGHYLAASYELLYRGGEAVAVWGCNSIAIVLVLGLSMVIGATAA